MAIYMVACPACKVEIPAIAAVCKHCGKGFRESTSASEEKRRRMALKAEGRASDPVVDVAGRLEHYVGANWNSHYRVTFLQLLNAQERGTYCGRTWNWSAALTPLWFFHRRLSSAGFGYLFLAFSIRFVQTSTVDWPEAQTFTAGLYVLLHIGSGIVADRLLFRKAYKKVTGAGGSVWA